MLMEPTNHANGYHLNTLCFIFILSSIFLLLQDILSLTRSIHMITLELALYAVLLFLLLSFGIPQGNENQFYNYQSK